MLHLFVSTQNLLTGAKRRLSREETGATAVEYGLMVGLIAVVIIAAVTLLGGGAQDMFNEAQCALNGDTWADATATCTVVP